MYTCVQYHLEEFEEAWQMSVPDDMTTHLSYLEVSFCYSYLSVCMYVCMSVCLSVCLSVARSATSSQLDVRPSRLVTVGDRSFASAGPKLWNSLPDDITSASSLSVFRQKLKTHLFPQSYPDVIF